MHSLPDSQEAEKVIPRGMHILSSTCKEIKMISNDNVSQRQIKPKIAGKLGMITIRAEVNGMQVKKKF